MLTNWATFNASRITDNGQCSLPIILLDNLTLCILLWENLLWDILVEGQYATGAL